MRRCAALPPSRGRPGSRVYCLFRAWCSGTHSRQSGFLEPVGTKLGLLHVPTLERLGPSASARACTVVLALALVALVVSGLASGFLFPGAVLVGRRAISGSKCEPVIDIGVRQRARARTSLAPTSVPRYSYSAPDSLQSAVCSLRCRYLSRQAGHGPMSAESHRGVTEGILYTGAQI
ncbi:hypothetical protein B0J13DRAFT_636197 [Dactylonectria estremocensis]|uniref:Uncharacterized protein n=1 Tax=Dactylonectria estremocensis TaxID=1079267 RepID=A0A9P9ERI6_9HYPO|nr:hypothetical protein B0J13DRAFT_636197 [Dactylonectria estremocensis]